MVRNMTRLVRHDATGPAVVKIGDKMVSICQCGLSNTKPFCDGSHAKVQNEKPELVYLYDHLGNRVSLDDFFPTQKQVFQK